MPLHSSGKIAVAPKAEADRLRNLLVGADTGDAFIDHLDGTVGEQPDAASKVHHEDDVHFRPRSFREVRRTREVFALRGIDEFDSTALFRRGSKLEDAAFASVDLDFLGIDDWEEIKLVATLHGARGFDRRVPGKSEPMSPLLMAVRSF